MPRKITPQTRQFFELAKRTENQSLSIDELPPLGVGVAAMAVDHFSMGTFFGEDWEILYQSEFKDIPLRGVYLWNNKTGQRFAIKIDPAEPKIKKLINLRGENNVIDHRGLHNVITRVVSLCGDHYRAMHFSADNRSGWSGPSADPIFRARNIKAARYSDEYGHVRDIANDSFYYFIFNGIGIHVSTTEEDLNNHTETFRRCDVIVDDKELDEAMTAYRALLKENEKW